MATVPSNTPAGLRRRETRRVGERTRAVLLSAALSLLAVALFDAAAYQLLPPEIAASFHPYRCPACVPPPAVPGGGTALRDYYVADPERGFDIAPNRPTMLHYVDGMLYQRVEESRLQPGGSGWKLTTSSATSVPVATRRTTSTAPSAVASTSRCAAAPATNSRGVPAPTRRRMIRPRL